jgi:Protein of unknown function (DUF2867)
MVQRVKQVPTPDDSLLAQVAAGADYEDTFLLRVPQGSFSDVDALARACLRFPGWIQRMMRLRNALVAPFGLKTGRDVPRLVEQPEHFAAGDRAGIFQIRARNAHELLMGEDDRHLDFRFSLLLREAGDFQDVFATTTVHFHNLWGRLYFLFVAPIHRQVIPSMLRHALVS